MAPNNQIDEKKEDRDEFLLSSFNKDTPPPTTLKNNPSTISVKDYFGFKTDLIWLNIIAITALHVIFLYMFFTYPYFTHFKTFLWGILVAYISGFGVTGGAHRLFTHRAFKAKTPLRVFLLLCFYASGQNSLYDWVRDHRVHHKYSETDADPHNSNRGFFFSHVGWLMMRKHQEVLKHGRQIDMSDITDDRIIWTLERYFPVLKFLLAFFIPTLIPVYFWNESWYFSIASQIIRYTIQLNAVWSVNSAAHIWGTKPYDNTIKPVENKWVSRTALGEGWHNYHHAFPWDYKAAELGNYSSNFTTGLIDAFAKLGWAYDLKEPSKQLVENVIQKTGDGTHPIAEKNHVE